MKKVIGLVPLWDEKKDSCWMLPGYMKVIEDGGGLPIILPLTADPEALEDCLRLCDGLLLTGGHDVDPALYGESPLPQCGAVCTLRDEMESYLLRRAVELDLPVLGICRGIQIMNAVLGGTLYQDLPTQHPSEVTHVMKPPYDQPVHTVEILEGTPLADLLGSGTYAVNSYHHQAVKTLAPDARPMAVSPDGLVEALYLPGKRFIWGVQWHPEFAYQTDENCRKLVEYFLGKL